MKTETQKDSNFLAHDFTAPWQSKITKEQWIQFLTHTFHQEDREKVYELLHSYLESISPPQSAVTNSAFYYKSPLTFLELGFGQCYDFAHCFMLLHDIETIEYTGQEVTPQFVEFAREEFCKYNNYKFKVGDFNSLLKSDIIYTRHVLEHQHPDNCYLFFENILKATKKLCIISWFCPPGEEKFTWNDRDGFNHEGAYVNVYSKDKLNNLIEKYNFKLTSYLNNKIYYMRKNNE